MSRKLLHIGTLKYVQEIVYAAFHEERVVMALVNELADECDFELQRFSEAMQRRFAEQCDVLAAQFTYNQTGIRNFRCLVCGPACSRRACRSHADPGKGDKSHDSRYSDQTHNRHDIRDRLVSRSMGTTPAGKNGFAVPRFRPYRRPSFHNSG